MIMYPRLLRSILICALLVFCVGCDQITKDLARQQLASAPPISWFHDMVRLEFAENPGAFLSLGAELSDGFRVVLFQVLPVVWLVSALALLVWSRSLSPIVLVGWTLILSGGIGNLLDRLLNHGRVIDFMNLGIGPIRTGIFNLADIFITAGVLLLLRHGFHQRDSSNSLSTRHL
ncbi:MAG: signal peptidase II [Nitrospiraceae bacterium]